MTLIATRSMKFKGKVYAPGEEIPALTDKDIRVCKGALGAVEKQIKSAPVRHVASVVRSVPKPPPVAAPVVQPVVVEPVVADAADAPAQVVYRRRDMRAED